MQCDNIFCVYWSKEKCALEEITLNAYGTCESCIYVDIDEKLLERKREEFFERSAQTDQTE